MEKVQVPSGEGEGAESEESGKQTTASSLLSPTSVTSPVEESPIFSIPKAEVCVYVSMTINISHGRRSGLINSLACHTSSAGGHA